MFAFCFKIHDKKLGKPIFILPNERSVQLKELLLAICINNSVMRAKEGRFNESPNYFGTSADEVYKSMARHVDCLYIFCMACGLTFSRSHFLKVPITL